MAYIHANDVVHRDIKLANIMLTGAGNGNGGGGGGGGGSSAARKMTTHHQLVARLGDFGLAKKMQGRYAQSVSGTLVYMAPEQQRGLYDAKVDIWALGATLVAMCNRRELSIVVATKAQAVSLAQSVSKSMYSSSMVAAVSAMLTFEPQHRPSAAEVLTMAPFAARAGVNAVALRSAAADSAASVREGGRMELATPLVMKATAAGDSGGGGGSGATAGVRKRSPVKTKMLSSV